MKKLEISSTQFTLQSERAIEEIRSRIMTFYGREDFEWKIKQFLNSRSKSDFKSVRRELMNMAHARRLNIGNIVMAEKIDESALWDSIREVPTREQIKFEFVKELHKIYKKFPTAEKFMARIIRRSSNNEFSADSLRLQILKLFVRNTNYHTSAIEKRILSDLTESEIKNYSSLDSNSKREFLIEKLQENIFIARKQDYSKVFDAILSWFEKKKSNFEFKEFATFDEIQTLNSSNDEEFINTTEKKFRDYISNFNVVENGEVIHSKETNFLTAKIDLIQESVNFFDALGIEDYRGTFALSFKEYAELLAETFPPNFQLSTYTNQDLLIMAKQLKLKTTTTHSAQQILQAVAQSKNKISASKKRTAILNKIENEILALEKFHTEDYRNLKSDFLKKYHEEFLTGKLRKSGVNGKCGLNLKDWREFLCKQIEEFTLPPPFIFPTESQFNDKTLDELQQNLILYLKNFRPKNESSFADIFRRAMRDFHRDSGEDMTLQNLAEDLASANFKPQKATKKQIYLLAFALDMDYDSFEKSLIQDFYSYNQISSEVTPLGEGINLKNYVEAIYVYFLYNRKLGTSAQRLDMAQATIENCFNQTKNLLNSNNPEDKLKVLKTAQLTDKYYSNRENFLNLNPTELTDYICKNFYVYDPSAKNARIMMASEMRTAQEIFLELIDKIEISWAKNYGISDAVTPENTVSPDIGIDVDDLIDDLQRNNDSELLSISKDENFLKLLYRLDKTLQVYQRGLLDKDHIKKQKFFSRTDLISLYYFYFANSMLQDAVANFYLTDFESLYDEFVGDDQSQRLNYYLKKCHFYAFSPTSTSIFDNFILFALFLDIIR